MSLKKSEDNNAQPIKQTELDNKLLSILQEEGKTLSLKDGTIVELIAHTVNTVDPETNPESSFSLGYFTTSGETPVTTTGNAPNLNADSQFDCNLSQEQFLLLKNSEPVVQTFGKLGLDPSKLTRLSVGVNVASGGAYPKK